MRILFVGYMGRGQTLGMRCEGLRRLGHQVEAVDAARIWKSAGYISRQLAQLTLRSARIERFNKEVIATACRFRPDLVWAEKQEYLEATTLTELKRLGAVTLHYNPDPYFSLAWKRTRIADGTLKHYDVLAVTKRYELSEYRQYCPGHVVYSPLGFDPVGHAPITCESDFTRDIGFVGGWEPRRERLLSASAELSARTTVWGYGWDIAQETRVNPLRALRLGRLAPGSPLYLGKRSQSLQACIGEGEAGNGEIYEERYAQAVATSKISLGFLREICPDQHTTRSFEIPAIGGFMLADRTEEHLEFFDEDREAAFFDSDQEYVEKVRYYLSHDEQRNRIARAGHERCMRSGYSYDDRMKLILEQL